MSESSWACPVCGLKFHRAPKPPIHCSCGFRDLDGAAQLRGIGDRLARLLHRLGITKRRAAAWQFWRKPADRKCNCAERQQALNEADNRLRAWVRGVTSWIRRATRWRA